MIMRTDENQDEVRVREALDGEVERWDDYIRGFPNHRVVHTRAWLQSLEASGYGNPLFLVFERGREVVGCLPGLLVSLGPWQAFGSPLPGWQTVSMGPAYDPDSVSAREMMRVLIPFLEERHRVVHIELMHDSLDGNDMEAQGFVGRAVPTYRAPLYPTSPSRAFKAMRTSARRNVRRAERLGLIIRVEHRDQFVDEHYDQVRHAYLRGGHTPPFSKARMRECFQRMAAAGNLVPVAAYLPGGRVCIATGMFFIEGKELLLWTWAHHPHYRWYRATEAMTWLAMQHAMNAGCETFDLMGRGQFKGKLGASLDDTKRRWIRSRVRWLTHARDAAESCMRGMHAVSGRLARLAGPGNRHEAEASRKRIPLPACVLGDVDLVHALGLAGVSSTVLAPPGAPARFSRYTHDTLPCVDAWERPDDLVNTLLEYSATQPEPPALFYQDDGTLLAISRHRDRLEKAFRFVIPDHTLVEQLVDKARFQQLARHLDLPVPDARVLYPSHQTMPTDLRYPVIVKPVTRRPARWELVGGGPKALRLETEDDLRRIWPQLAALGDVMLAQTLVPGPESRIESYHVYVDRDDRVIAEFTGRKIRTYPRSFGDSTALEITDAPDVRKLGREIARRLRLRGVAKMDFKRAPDNRLYLLEVNPRFTLWHHLGAAAGVNIPAIVYEDVRGQERPAIPEPRVGVRWCKLWTDHRAARAHGMPFHQWLAWALSCDAKSAVAWTDPVPLVAAAVAKWLRRNPSDRPPPTNVPNVVVSSITQ